MILILGALLFRPPYIWAAGPITPSGLNTQVSDPIAVGAQTQFNITGGTRPNGGLNLFHSFGEFGVPTNNIANFLNETALPTSNILARVTGNIQSDIFGTIQTTGFGNANLFLMNPNGFLFGPNATVNIGGMATFTTADYMRLTDGGRFNANPLAIPTDLLTAAPVAAFGFLGSNPAAINFEGGQLTVAQGTGITLVGGDISLVPDPISSVPSSITAPGRRIQLTSVAGPGEVAADTAVPGPGMVLWNITLGQDTILSTVGDPTFGDGSGGAVTIRGGQFVASGAQILTNPAPGSAGQGGAVGVTTSNSASFTNSTIDTSSLFANGGGGSVSVTASDLTVQDSTIMTSVFGDSITPITGGGGAVILTGTESVTLTRSPILTASILSNGNGGAVTVMAPIVSVEDSFINTGVVGDGITPITASGGAVTLSGTTSVSLTGSSLIGTESFDSQGNAGPITITAPTVMIAGFAPFVSTINASTHNSTADPNAGHGGDITITGTNVTFTNFAEIDSFADSPGTFSRGGAIRITGSQNILIDNGTFFLTTTTSLGNAGNMDLVGQHVTIRGESVLASETFGPASGGTIRITGGENIAIESASRISTTSPFAVDNQGPAGLIEFNTQQLTVTGGSQVSSSTFHNGAGGTITVQGTNSQAQSVLIDGAGSGIFTTTEGTGIGGDINILAGQSVTMTNGSSVSASSTGPGNAGNIQINAGNQFAMTNSSVTTEANQASGGTIKITTTPSGTVQLINSTISASVLDGTGGGGSVNIDPQFVILQNSQILAQAVQGPGGNLTIAITNGGLFLSDANSNISAKSQFGVSGTVTIQSPNSPASGKIQPLGKTPLQATSLLNQRCAALAGGEFSSFTVAGRDSLPTEPGSWLASPLAGLSAGTGLAMKAEGVKAEGERIETPLLSLRQIAPAGFLTQAFALDWSAGCTS